MAKTKAKTKTKKKPARPASTPLIGIHVKLNKREYAQLVKAANWWCMGNISAWLRYTGLKYMPKRGENVSRAIAEKKY